MASRFWVGGAGVWDAATTTHWSATTGGAGGASAPTSADDVFFDANSGAGTVTSSGTRACRNLVTTNASVALGMTTNIQTNGPTVTLGKSFTSTSMTLVPQVSTTITSNGFQVPGGLSVSVTGITVTLADALDLGATGALTHTAGTLDTTGQAMTIGALSCTGSTTRVLTLGASAITCSGAWTVTGSNITVNAGTSSITITGTGQFSGLAASWYDVAFTTAGQAVVTGSTGMSFHNLTRTGTAAKTDRFSLLLSVTISNNFTVTSNSDINRVLVDCGSTTGQARTITAANVVIGNTVEFQDIIGAGAATWTVAGTGATALGDCQGNSGITFTTPATQTFAGGTKSWSDVSAWTSRVPLPQDDVVVATTAVGTLTADMPRLGHSINFTGFTRTFTRSVATTVYGNFTLASGMTWTASSFDVTFAGRGTHTLTSNGITMGVGSSSTSVIFAAITGKYVLQDDLTVTNATSSQGVKLLSGELDLNGHDVYLAGSASQFNSATTTWARTLTPNGGRFITSGSNTSAGFKWNVAAANLTYTTPPNFTVGVASANSTTFGGGGMAYGTLDYTIAGSTGGLVITGANTFATINFSDVTNARTLTLPASTTTTVLTAFNVNGTSGKLMSVISSTSGTAATLSLSGIGVDVICDYLSIKDSTVTAASGYKAYAGYNSTNVSGNTGWTFNALPVGSSRQAIWNVRAAVGSQRQVLWPTRIAVGSQRQLVWAVRTAVGATRQLIWSVALAVGSSRALQWAIRAAVGSQRQTLWAVRTAVGASRSMVWPSRAAAGSSRQLVWNVRLAVGSSRVLIWALRAAVGSQRSLVWPTATLAGASRSLEWPVREAVGSARTLLWDVAAITSTTVGSERTLGWSVRHVAGASKDLRWTVAAAAGSSRSLSWPVRTAASSERTVEWPVRAAVGSSRQLRWSTRAAVGPPKTLRWGVKTATGSVRQLAWPVRTMAGTSRTVVWRIAVLAGSSRTLRWRVGGLPWLIDLGVRDAFVLWTVGEPETAFAAGVPTVPFRTGEPTTREPVA